MSCVLVKRNCFKKITWRNYRGACARGQGVLTALTQKSQNVFASTMKKSMLISKSF